MIRLCVRLCSVLYPFLIKSRYDLLFLSPHLDDVAISCAGRIIHELAKGKHILVATLFSLGSETDESKKVYSCRRQEDEEAMQLLGVDHILLDLKDAPCRDNFYSSFERMFIEESKGDKDFQTKVSTQIKQICEEHQPEIVFFPLAIGGHIDHRLTCRGFSAVRQRTKVEFYEDRPYVFLRNNINYRLRAMNASAIGIESEGIDDLNTLVSSADEVELYKGALPKGNRKRHALSRLMKEGRENLDGGFSLTLEPQIVPVKATDYNLLKKVVLTYRSQSAGLFGGPEGWEKLTRAYTKEICPDAKYAERSWRLVN